MVRKSVIALVIAFGFLPVATNAMAAVGHKHPAHAAPVARVLYDSYSTAGCNGHGCTTMPYIGGVAY